MWGCSREKKISYLGHRKILKVYPYGYFETESLYLWTFRFDFLMQHQLSFQSYYQGTFRKQADRFNKNSCHHRDSFRYSCVVLGHSQCCFCGPSWANALYCDLHHELHPHSNDWRNRKTHSKFANTQRDTTWLIIASNKTRHEILF